MTGLEALAAAAATAAASVPAWVPTAASVAATAASGALAYGSASKQAGMSKMAGERNAQELERAADEARADGARKAAEHRMQGEKIMSRQRAVAASGGAGAGGTEGYLDVVGDTAERSQYLSDLDIASGENTATGLEDKAALSRWKGGTESDLYKSKGTGALVGAGFDIAATGLKRAPVAAGSADDFVDQEYGNQINDGWTTTTRRTKSKLRYG